MRRSVAGSLAAAVMGAVLLLAAGCASGQPGDLTAAAESVLAPKVQQIREIAANGNYNALVQAVRQLKRLVAQEVADNQVSQSRANAILDAADTLLTDAQPPASPTPSQSPSSASPTPSPTPTSASPTPTPSTTPSSSSPSPGTTITIGGIPH